MNADIDISGLIIQTPRIKLRPWTMDDLEDLYLYASVPGVGEMAGWSYHKSIDESREILELFIRHKKTLALEVQGRAVGSIGIEMYNPLELPDLDHLKGRELGYVLSKDYWGQGLMTEGLKALIAYLFDEIGLDFLACASYPSNQGSARVQAKCGFKYVKDVEAKTYDGKISTCSLSILMAE